MYLYSSKKLSYSLVIVCSLLFIGGLFYTHKMFYEKGIEAGIRAYHAQCLVGGFLIDDAGQAIVCGPLSKTPKEEQQTYKDKVVAPSLFN